MMGIGALLRWVLGRVRPAEEDNGRWRETLWLIGNRERLLNSWNGLYDDAARDTVNSDLGGPSVAGDGLSAGLVVRSRGVLHGGRGIRVEEVVDGRSGHDGVGADGFSSSALDAAMDVLDRPDATWEDCLDAMETLRRVPRPHWADVSGMDDNRREWLARCAQLELGAITVEGLIKEIEGLDGEDGSEVFDYARSFSRYRRRMFPCRGFISGVWRRRP